MKRNAFGYVVWLTIVATASTLASAQSQPANQGEDTSYEMLLNGDAMQCGDRLRLTPSAMWQAGSAWFTQKYYVQDGFTATFQFQITQLGVRHASEAGADGFAFVIQNSSESALGDKGGGMGYGTDPARCNDNRGITNSLAIEFDTFDNAGQGNGDPGHNHVSVQMRAKGANSCNHAYSLGETDQIPNLKNGNVHTARIIFQAGVLQVFIDDLTTPVLAVPMEKLGLTLDNGTAWVGFTAATGESWASQNILSWSFTSSRTGCCVSRDEVNLGARARTGQPSVIAAVAAVTQRSRW